MSLWIEIVICVTIPIILFYFILMVSKLNNLIIINNGIFKQNNKIYKYILMSGLFDVGKDLLETGKKIIQTRKEKKRNV